MTNFILIIVSAILLYQWIKWLTFGKAMVEFIKMKHYPAPSTEDLKLCSRRVCRKIFNTED